jgi:hypothetical protein
MCSRFTGAPLEHAQAVPRRFLGMELDAEHVFALDGRRETLAVLGGADDRGRVARADRVGVHVVEGAARLGQPGGQARGTLEAHLVPPDVRDAKTPGRQARDLARDQAETGRRRELLRALEQQLHP